MIRTIFWYAISLAVLAGVMTYVKYRFLLHEFSTELTIGLLAIAFTALGAWVGNRLTRKQEPEPVERNEAAIRSLSLTSRELEVLERMSSGQSNDEIATHLSISLHTVKTHVSSILSKLDVARRTQAVDRAKKLRIIR